MTPEQLVKKALLFEQSMGVIMGSCLTAIEACQTIDLPLLMGHIAEVRWGKKASSTTTLTKSCITYFFSIVD
jgi:hypothetical protein